MQDEARHKQFFWGFGKQFRVLYPPRARAAAALSRPLSFLFLNTTTIYFSVLFSLTTFFNATQHINTVVAAAVVVVVVVWVSQGSGSQVAGKGEGVRGEGSQVEWDMRQIGQVNDNSVGKDEWHETVSSGYGKAIKAREVKVK